MLKEEINGFCMALADSVPGVSGGTAAFIMDYHDNQPWNENMLRPCSVLDNPGSLINIVEESHAKSTDYQNLESAKEFSDKCVDTSKKWKPTTDSFNDAKNMVKEIMEKEEESVPEEKGKTEKNVENAIEI